MICYFRIIVSKFRNLNFLESYICRFPVQLLTNCCINNSSSDGANLYCYEATVVAYYEHGANVPKFLFYQCVFYSELGA